MKDFFYNSLKIALTIICRPKHLGSLPTDSAKTIIYVLPHRSFFDLVSLDIFADRNGLPRPVFTGQEQRQGLTPTILYLFSGSSLTSIRPNFSNEVMDLINLSDEERENVEFIPCLVFWGRSLNKKSIRHKRLFFSHWSNPGIKKRLINLILNWSDIWIHTAEPISLNSLLTGEKDPHIIYRKITRILRKQIRNQQTATLGPSFTERKRLIADVLNSKQVSSHTTEEADTTRESQKIGDAQKIASSIASDMSYSTIRLLITVLNWFWNRIYEGIELKGTGKLNAFVDSHTLVYVPCHRSHLDYLLLSFLLFQKGLMIPHIASGDNLNIPILGKILRQGGAFFMRRRFNNDRLYSDVFNEYLYQIYNQGHSVEFFPEGGRSRSGRLLKPKLGLIKTSVNLHSKGLRKPIAFVPVYIGYEKIIEGSTYVSELRGSKKTREKLSDLLNNLKLIRQNFGMVQVNIGEVIPLDRWLQANESDHGEHINLLAEHMMSSINEAATVNSVNLAATVLLSTNHQSLDKDTFKAQLTLYIKLIGDLFGKEKLTEDIKNADSILERLEHLGLLKKDISEFGEVLYFDNFTAVLMTWYQNNAIHLFSLTSLISILIVNRRVPISKTKLLKMIKIISPYLGKELSIEFTDKSIENCFIFLETNHLIRTENDLIKAPLTDSSSHKQLELLAKIISPTIERMFITLSLITKGNQKIDQISHKARNVAQKISRLYGINAPEFFDLSLFDNFLEELTSRKAIHIKQDGVIIESTQLREVVRHSKSVITAEIRRAISQAAAP